MDECELKAVVLFDVTLMGGTSNSRIPLPNMAKGRVRNLMAQWAKSIGFERINPLRIDSRSESAGGKYRKVPRACPWGSIASETESFQRVHKIDARSAYFI